MASSAFGSLWFAWQWANLQRQAGTRVAGSRDAIREAEFILGYRRRRSTLFVHNGLSATRPYLR